MTTTPNPSSPRTLADLLAEVAARPAGTDASDALLRTLKAHGYWPALNIKRFGDLVLLHNSHRRNDVFEFQELYDECRSVVLDLKAAGAPHIVYKLAHGMLEHISAGQYAVLQQEGDECSESFDGTCVSAYCHGGVWHFSTPTCPDIDGSRFFHATKTHGLMLDEALKAVSLGRADFTAHLDDGLAYTFILVHHENRPKFGTDYEKTYGENYAFLVHISTHDRQTGDEVPGAVAFGTYKPRAYAAPSEAVEAVRNAKDPFHGFVVKRGGKAVYRVSTDEAVLAQEREAGNSNAWHNMLYVYMQNRPDFRVHDWAKANLTEAELAAIVDEDGARVSPAYALHTVMSHMRNVLYDLYRVTTEYYAIHKRFRMDKVADASLHKMLRFHLGQLRHLQVTQHTHAVLTKHSIYHYLCHHQSIKNVRLLIQFFDRFSATDMCGFVMSPRTRACFRIVARGLRG